MDSATSIFANRRSAVSDIRLWLMSCFAFVLIWAGCASNPTVPTPPPGNTTTTIAGRVTDESGAGLAGVTITSSTTSTMTDANGLFSLPDATVPSDRAFIIAKKAGYFDGARAAVPSSDGVTYMRIAMAASTVAGTVDALAGGTITLSSGATVGLLPSGVVTSSGSPYTGTVSVSAKHLDPSNTQFANLFTGDMTGVHTDGTSAELKSFGVVIAELHGSNGEVLQPAPGKPSTLSMPITSALQSLAPASIPLWYFDETLGMWKEEGSATKQGTTYTGTVQHFSFWNYDMTGPYGTITGRIVCGGVPLQGVFVNLGAYVEGGQPTVITDGSGEFRVRVVANSNLVTLQVIASENGGVYFTSNPRTINIPADQTTDLGDISLDSPCPNYLTGTMKDCNGTPVAGMVLAQWQGNMTYAYTKDGHFKLVAPAGKTITLSGTSNTGAASQPQTVVAGAQGDETAVADVVACNGTTSDVHKDINGSFNGQVLAFSPDNTKLAVLDANGTDVEFFDVTTGATASQIAGAFKTGSTSQWLRFSPDGTRVVTGYTFQYAGNIDCWLVSGTKLTGTSILGTSAVFTSDGLSIVYATGDSSKGHAGVFEYSIAQAQNILTLAVTGYYGLNVVGLAPGGTQVVLLSSYPSTATIWDLTSNAAVLSFGDSAGYNVSYANLSYDSKIIGVSDGTHLYFFSTQTGKEISTQNIGLPYGGSYGLSPDDATYIGQYRAGQANTVGTFSLIDGTSTHIFDAPASGGFTTGVAISPNGKLAAAVYGGLVRIWDVK